MRVSNSEDKPSSSSKVVTNEGTNKEKPKQSSTGGSSKNSNVKKPSNTKNQKAQENKSAKGGKNSNKKQKKEKPPKPKKERVGLDPPKAGRIVLSVFVAIIFSFLIVVLVWGGYLSLFKYPKHEEVDETQTGKYCLDNWINSVNTLEGTGEDSYLAQELVYANGDKDKIAFLKKVASTIKYTPDTVEAKDIYGNTLINRNDEVVYEESTILAGEEVTLTYIDYKHIPLNKEKISLLMKEANLTTGDIDYSNKLVSVFCKYINSLEGNAVKIKNIRYTPNIIRQKDGTYAVTKDEDIFIDKILYSSDDLHYLMQKFSIVACTGVNNPAWDEWNALSEKKKAKQEEPVKVFEELQPLYSWTEWNNLEDSEKAITPEPIKYNPKDLMLTNWCGSYYLQNEYSEVDENGNSVQVSISANVGSGTFENPAGLNTEVVTNVYVDELDENGNPVTNKYPIRIEMTDFGVSEDAIVWFESKDERNRGIDIKSEKQYCYYTFKVTNLSSKVLTIPDNITLCDKNANVSPRTGTIYGIQDSVTLQPDETGTIETWGSSTELNKKYVIWGKDFARRENPIWFRVLMGNLEDTSENKGVHVNNSRYSDDEEEVENVAEETDETTESEE